MESGVPQTSRGAVSLGEDLSAVIARPSWSIGDYTIALNLLKLGAIVNLYFLAMTLGSGAADPYVVLPALILFAVSAYRCLYPVRYEHDVVFHASLFLYVSIFVIATARDLCRGRLDLFVRVCPAPVKPQSCRMGHRALMADGRAGRHQPVFRLDSDPDRAPRTLLL